MKKLGVVLAAGVLAASLALFGCSSNSTAGNDTKKDDSAKADTSYTLVTDAHDGHLRRLSSVREPRER